MRYLLILLLLTGCTSGKLIPTKGTSSFNSTEYIEICETFGGRRECYLMERSEAEAKIRLEYQRMLNRMGRF